MQSGQDVLEGRDGRGQGADQHVPGTRDRSRQGLHAAGNSSIMSLSNMHSINIISGSFYCPCPEKLTFLISMGQQRSINLQQIVFLLAFPRPGRAGKKSQFSLNPNESISKYDNKVT